MNLLDDRVAVVTGAASGIGAAIAEAHLAEGARLLLADLSRPAARGRAYRRPAGLRLRGNLHVEQTSGPDSGDVTP